MATSSHALNLEQKEADCDKTVLRHAYKHCQEYQSA